MQAIAGVVSCGVYVPRLRLSRERIAQALQWLGPDAAAAATGARAICNWDEDALTLAVEAARQCLAACSADTLPPVAVTLASTSLPFSDRSNATLLASALDLSEATETTDCGGSLRAATTALVQAGRRGDGAATLLVGSDARLAQPGSLQEMEFGAGAAAFLVVPASATRATTPVLATICAASHVAADFVDHYRMSGAAFDYALEERWRRDAGVTKLIPAAIANALRAAQCEPASIDHLVMPGPASVAQRVARAAGLTRARVQDNLREECGDTGAAHPLMLLAAALEQARPRETIVLSSFGQGVDALVLVAGEGLRSERRPVAEALSRGKSEPHYTRYLSNHGLLQIDFGMRAERDNRTAHTVAWRKHRQIDGFVGGRCVVCDTVQFPPSRVCVNPQCRRTDTQVDHRLADVGGRVKSFTEDRQAYSPRPPYMYGNVEFECGGNLLMELTDVESGELQVADRVRFVFRVKDVDSRRAFKRYFWKATKL